MYLQTLFLSIDCKDMIIAVTNVHSKTTHTHRMALAEWK